MENNELLQAIKTIVSQEIKHFKHEINQRFDSLETKIDSLETKVDSLETKVDSLETKVNSLETKVDSLETKVDKLEQGQKEMKEIMIKNDLTVANFATDINEYVNKRIKETEANILAKFDEVEMVTASNCYSIALLKQNQKRA